MQILKEFWKEFHFFWKKKKSYNSFWNLRNSFRKKEIFIEEYFPNLLKRGFLCQIFVAWVRDFKFRLIADFWIFYKSAKFQKDWTNLILNIHSPSPFDIFCFCNLPRIQRGDSCKMSNINVVHSFWNFAKLKKIKKWASSQNLKSLTQKTKIWHNNVLSRRFGR